MPLSSIGDMRQHFLNVRNNSSLRTDLETLVQELTTGKAADLTSHLQVNQTQLSSLDRTLRMIDRFDQTNTQTAQMLSMMQVALSGIETYREQTMAAFLIINPASSDSQIQNAADISLSGFEATVQSLNIRYADNPLFGGNDLDNSPLASAETMLDSIKLAVSGLTSASDIRNAVDTWFDAPGGAFETIGYLSDADSLMKRNIDLDQSFEVRARADDPTFKKLMKSFALGALAGDFSSIMPTQDRRALQSQVGMDLVEIAAPLNGIQAELGYRERQIEEASVKFSAQTTTLGIARNNLVSADPFDTATKLEQVQIQLETHYTLTARLSRLSLTEYLR